MRGQLFSADLAVAFMIILAMLVFFIQSAGFFIGNEKNTFSNFDLQRKAFFASEELVRFSLAKYENNSYRHHVIDLDKVPEVNQSVCFRLESRSGKVYSDCNETSVKRVVLCGGELCELEV